MFNELKFTETTKAQISGRIERVDLTGTTPAFIPEMFDLAVNPDDRPADGAQPVLYAEERQHRPDPEPARA